MIKKELQIPKQDQEQSPQQGKTVQDLFRQVDKLTKIVGEHQQMMDAHVAPKQEGEIESGLKYALPQKPTKEAKKNHSSRRTRRAGVQENTEENTGLLNSLKQKYIDRNGFDANAATQRDQHTRDRLRAQQEGMLAKRGAMMEEAQRMADQLATTKNDQRRQLPQTPIAPAGANTKQAHRKSQQRPVIKPLGEDDPYDPNAPKLLTEGLNTETRDPLEASQNLQEMARRARDLGVVDHFDEETVRKVLEETFDHSPAAQAKAKQLGDFLYKQTPEGEVPAFTSEDFLGHQPMWDEAERKHRANIAAGGPSYEQNHGDGFATPLSPHNIKHSLMRAAEDLEIKQKEKEEAEEAELAEERAKLAEQKLIKSRGTTATTTASC